MTDAVLRQRSPVRKTPRTNDDQIRSELPCLDRDCRGDVIAVRADDLGLGHHAGAQEPHHGRVDELLRLTSNLDVPAAVPMVHLEVPDVPDPDPHGR